MLAQLCLFPAKVYFSSFLFPSLSTLTLWSVRFPADLLAPCKSDFIKSLTPLVIYTVFDERHWSRCVDLIAALICLFNGVVEWKVVTARRSTKRWVTAPAGERWKGKMQNGLDVRRRAAELNKVFMYTLQERPRMGKDLLLNRAGK